jgi:hypothetical protein
MIGMGIVPLFFFHGGQMVARRDIKKTATRTLKVGAVLLFTKECRIIFFT